ncbi:hypothetical protein JOF46_003570 [Paeniglutamicibacter psychrophenolicus]|uniref:Uncharacterized protein n=1 Tax=Paeniglutamicibacter psychrophenolicus TaxID=257454 RepID=A0ABS4WHI3_9MICC|nr:hypothetical protein [Paeniglutamicibacter psychrophenolicus]
MGRPPSRRPILDDVTLHSNSLSCGTQPAFVSLTMPSTMTCRTGPDATAGAWERRLPEANVPGAAHLCHLTNLLTYQSVHEKA